MEMGVKMDRKYITKEEAMEVLQSLAIACSAGLTAVGSIQFPLESGISHIPCHNISFHLNEVQCWADSMISDLGGGKGGESE